ncbi:MAG: hypothetical protein KAF40_01960 [Flavihumibacter sp.]|nr:hypothetical protein [Flavihumibacter sp.]
MIWICRLGLFLEVHEGIIYVPDVEFFKAGNQPAVGGSVRYFVPRHACKGMTQNIANTPTFALPIEHNITSLPGLYFSK